jgi:hypothetical protein
MAILNNSNAISTAGGYDINNSLRFRRSASAYLNRTFSTPTNNKIWTWSGWVKRGALGTGTGQTLMGYGISGTLDSIGFNSSEQLYYFSVDSGGVTQRANYNTTAVFRDPSAWYHIVVAVDTTQATAGNRFKLYVNGVQQTVTTTTSLALNWNTYINSALSHGIAYQFDGTTNYLDGYLTETNFIDGQQLTPSSFGETDTTTGSWKPKAYTGTYGTNGFYLKFSDIATTSGSNAGLGKDFSGNANYWTTNNISVTAGTTYDAMIDSPTLTSATVANYAVMNPIAPSASSFISNGNLTVTVNNGSVIFGSTITLNGGKFYCEFDVTSLGGSGVGYIGIYNGIAQYWYQNDGQKFLNGTSSAYGATWTTGDNIGVAFDDTTGTLTFYKNGTSQGAISTGVSPNLNYTFSCIGGSATSRTYNANFGQRPFTYTPPTGFVRLNTYNLPDSTIKKGNTVMDATIYSGNSTNNRSIVNDASFRPDFVWIKPRSNADTHQLYDSVRGAGNNSELQSNSTAAEGGNNSEVYGYMSAFTSTGFTVTAGTDPSFPYALVNMTGRTYVGWQWQAGQGSTSSNTQGTITSTVSVNATAGFSVVSFAYPAVGSQTVGHGLGVAPKMIILKSRSTATLWVVYHASTGNTGYLSLSTTDAFSANSTVWNNTSPTSSVFTLGSGFTSAGYGANGIAYCWAAIPGYSAFTSYTGNGSADGPFVFLGFRPKFVMIKRSSAVADWFIYDAVRNTYNVCNLYLEPNASAAEGTATSFDLLSNGFKLRDSLASFNSSGDTFIVAAWAENPFKNSNAR